LETTSITGWSEQIMGKEDKNKLSRRNILKGMIGVPFLGYFANRFFLIKRSV
jgi:hypothetical protein